MGRKWDEIKSVLAGCEDGESVFEATATFAREFDFEYCSYGLRMPIPAHKPPVAIFNTYPPGWMDHYLAQNFLSVDPTVIHGSRSLTPIIWSDEIFSAAKPMWADAHDFGLRFGIAQSCWLGGGVFGLLTLARSSRSIDKSEAQGIAQTLCALTSLTHERMTELIGPTLAPQRAVLLTPREREVLLWTSEGKTSAEIGQILAISERTVNFHVSNVLTKFNAPNKIQAAVRAIALGLL